MYIRLIVKILCFIVTLFWGCRGKETVPIPDQSAFDYFPLEVGRYAIYDVNETSYNITSVDRKSYQLKLLVVDTFYLLKNEPVNYRLKTFTRANQSQDWLLDSVWSSQILGQDLVFNRNNRPTVILRNPIAASNTWNGNMYNNLNGQNFRYSNIRRPYLGVTGERFENSITVTAERSASCVDKKFAYDIYAPSIGLLYHHREYLNYEQDLSGGIIRCDSVIQFGSKVIWQIRSYGKE